jgi:uncharacterized membrane protein YdjX (TVP38/TMEM64 family)
MDAVTRRQFAGMALLGGVVATGALLLSPERFLSALAAVGARPAVFLPLLAAGYLLRPAVAWPISALSVVVGYVYGIPGIPLALAGAVLTCFPPYLLARRARTDAGVLGRVGDSGRRYFRATGDLRGLVVARLVPLPADSVSYAAGVSGIGLGTYALATAIGETPWVTGAVLVGASMERLAVNRSAGPWFVVGAVVLAALLLAGPAYRRYRANRIREERSTESEPTPDEV